jgi:ubiquinone/menaquinone biosynthesis C-methylase UbiE
MSQYLFTDSELAAERLRLLARVFAPAMSSFIRALDPPRPERLLDLGCGPGYTTRQLADLTDARQVVGLDNSPGFLALANRDRPPHMTFHQHDLTILPFPTEPADLIYARYLLTHLPKPLTLIERWSTQLQPVGLLLVEEVEWIESDIETFNTYLAIVAAMLASQSTELYLGPVLGAWQPGETLRRHVSRVQRLPVVVQQAAGMFYMNIQSWKHNAFIKGTYPAADIEALEADLAHLTEIERPTGRIEWGLRQIAFTVG